jgi:hypothetical protein
MFRRSIPSAPSRRLPPARRDGTPPRLGQPEPVQRAPGPPDASPAEPLGATASPLARRALRNGRPASRTIVKRAALPDELISLAVSGDGKTFYGVLYKYFQDGSGSVAYTLVAIDAATLAIKAGIPLVGIHYSAVTAR